MTDVQVPSARFGVADATDLTAASSIHDQPGDRGAKPVPLCLSIARANRRGERGAVAAMKGGSVEALGATAGCVSVTSRLRRGARSEISVE